MFLCKEDHPRDIIEKLIGHQQAEIFAEWAWGENYRSMVFTQNAVAWWNERHGDKLEIHANNRPKDDIPKMIELWKKEKDCQIKH